jgi:two-component system chemotaxis response regulator CheY
MKLCLIVDDSKVVRKFSRAIIESFQLSVEEACDGQEALEQCKKKLPDVIMLDWNMPVMDGMEFLKQFRANKAWADVIVIFCTSMNDMTSIQAAMSSGANEYIMKPFDKEVLKTKFEQMNIL